jgi:hypothetical protein
MTLDDFRLKEVKINKNSDEWFVDKKFLKPTKEDYYRMHQFEYLVPIFTKKDIQRIGRKHQNFERDYSSFRSEISQNLLTATAEEGVVAEATESATEGTVMPQANVVKAKAEVETLEESKQINLAKGVSLSLPRKASNSNDLDNSPNLTGYLVRRTTDLQKLESDASMNSDAKSSIEMKSNSSNHSKISIDNMEKGEQNSLNDKEDKNKPTTDSIANQCNEYDVNDSIFDQESRPINISTCHNDKSFGSLHEKKVIENSIKENEEVIHKQKKNNKKARIINQKAKK